MNIKKVIKSLIPHRKVDLHGFKYTVQELVGMHESTAEATQWHGKKLDNDILQYKSSDTVFILGSGPSINDITERQWNKIAECDSIGFNYWFAHDFVPDIYVFQSPNDKMLRLLSDNYELYKNIPFIIRGTGFAQGKFDFNDERLNLLKQNPVFYLNEYPISSKCSIDPELLYKYMDALGFMAYAEIPKFIPKWRSTIGLLIMLSYNMGYKNIVLCGVDMMKSDHFWDYEPYLELREKYQLPKPGSSRLAFRFEDGHSTSLPQYIYTLRDWMYKKNDVNISILSERTILHPEIKKYSEFI